MVNKWYWKQKMNKYVGTAASVCLNPKNPGSCLNLRVYKCKDICNFVNNSKYENYMNKSKVSL
jgi:hypothetical protein